MAQQQVQPEDNGMIQSYRMFNLVLYLGYGAGLLYTAKRALDWQESGHAALEDLVYGLPLDLPWPIILVCAAAPFVTAPLNPIMRTGPRTIGGGVAGALIMVALSFVMYHILGVLMANGLTQNFREFSEITPLLFKCFAGMSVSAHILIGFSRQMASTAAKPQKRRSTKTRKASNVPQKREKHSGWRPPADAFGGARLTHDALRELRHERMPSLPE